MTSAPPSVLVVGSINADIFLDVPRLPLHGETLAATGSRCLVGGKGSNQAVAASCTMVPTTFLGQFGSDYANLMKDYLANASVKLDPSCKVHSDTVSGQATIFLLPSGENAIVIVPGANAVWPTELSQEIKASIARASVVALQCEIPAYVNKLVAMEAKAAGTKVVWDLGGEEREVDDTFLRFVDYMCPNETELKRLVGFSEPLETQEQVVNAAKSLQARFGVAVLVTRGSEGSLLLDKDGTLYSQASLPAQVRDTTGAGDCFRGTFAAMLAQQKSIPECLLYAAASSALCVQQYGAKMPSFEDTQQFLKTINVKI
ncbi:hypothetical protein AC1031_001612 [Aphanomyces cochlioides]|nr:hypothetical protein AC1031_001612 [Aphanomyces cochlioides]